MRYTIVMTAATTLAALVLVQQGWAQPNQTAEFRAAMADWTAKGKPYIPGAARPQDLPQAGIPAFPGAEGAGRFSFGGRGGQVYVVTSLEDSGPGTFREAAEAIGPRIIVFNVAGIIDLKGPVNIDAPYVTSAGQTAPGDGVVITGESVLINTHDVVIRHMRFRRGATNRDRRDDALGGHPVGNIIIDHCSFSWGLDENVSLYRHMYNPPEGGPAQKLPTVNLTIQWSISSEALDTYNHAFGATWGGRNTSFHHNLFASNTGRVPSIGMGFDFNFVNNVIFNWRHRTMDGGDHTSLVNAINNYYKPGPATNQGAIQYRVGRPQPTGDRNDPTIRRYGRWHASGNFVEGNERVSADNWSGGIQFDEGSDEEIVRPLIQRVRSVEPFPMAPITIHSAQEAYELVLAHAGATLPRRDPVDQRVIEAVRTGNVSYPEGNGIITDISQVGGLPQYRGQPWVDSDGDGMPDWWEQKHGLDPHDPSDAAGDLNGDGYTNIEMFINGIDPTTKIDWTDPKNNRDTLTAGRLSPTAAAR